MGTEEGRPVFRIAAEDPAALATLDAYISLAAAQGASQEHLNEVQRTRERMRAWQQEHADQVKVPEL